MIIMTNTNQTKDNTMTDTKRGSTTQAVKDIMNANGEKPMHETCAIIAKDLSMTMSYARAWYRDFAKRSLATGVVEKAPTKAKTAVKRTATKAVVKTVKPDADRLDRLKAAAKKAGIHLDAVEKPVLDEDSEPEVRQSDDPLGLAAPDSLSLDDLKNVL